MTEHTPGPWAVLNGFPGVIVMAADRTLANGGSIHAYDYGTVYARQIARAYTAHNMPGDLVSNARLIAAAPGTAQERDCLRAINKELVEALFAFESRFDETFCDGEFAEAPPCMERAVKLARNALAKAKAAAA